MTDQVDTTPLQQEIPAPIQAMMDRLRETHVAAVNLQQMGGPYQLVCDRIREGIETLFTSLQQPPADEPPPEAECSCDGEEPPAETPTPDVAPPPPPAAEPE